jgi:ComF family protein
MRFRILDLLSPPACAACDTRLEREAVFCPSCAGAFVPTPPHVVRGLPVFAAGAYGGPLADAVQRLKFGDRPDLARPLGDLLRAVAQRSGLACDLVVPVPLHRRRRLERGYNQAALLARSVTQTVEARLDVDSLERLRADGPQVALGAAARARNVEGAFAVRPGRSLQGCRVLLVDDVVTTGATAEACAAALQKGGATTVAVLCVARVQ